MSLIILKRKTDPMSRPSTSTKISDLNVGDVVMADPADDATAKMVMTVSKGMPAGEKGFGKREVRVMFSDMTRIKSGIDDQEQVLLVGRVDLDGEYSDAFGDPLSIMTPVSEDDLGL